MNNRMIERALVFAVKELKHVSQMQPRERVFQEAQLQCARYRYFRNQHMSVHAEAGYPDGDGRLNGGRLKCDLVVSSRSKNQMWIELAIASHPDKSENRRVLRYKPGNIKKWKDDIGKLTKYAPKSARKIFWVLGLFDGNPQNGAGGGLMRKIEMIDRFHQRQKNGKKRSRLNFQPFPLSWRNTEIHGQFRVWKWK